MAARQTSGIWRVFADNQQLTCRATAFSAEGVVRTPDNVSDQAAYGNRVTPDVNSLELTLFDITPEVLNLVSTCSTIHIQFGDNRVAIMTNVTRADNNPIDADTNELDVSFYTGDPVRWARA